MANANTVTVVGNTTRDAELRYTPAGTAVANFGLAHNTRRRKPNTTDEWIEETSFFDVTVWSQQAQNVAESIPKGTRVIVTGRLRQRTWKADDGSNRSAVEIVADTVGPSMEWATAIVVRNERREPVAAGNAPADRPPLDEEPF